MAHEMCLQILHRKLYLAPIKQPQRVIDLGTGTGIWAIDFGKFVCWFAGLLVWPMQVTDADSSLADVHPEAEVKNTTRCDSRRTER